MFLGTKHLQYTSHVNLLGFPHAINDLRYVTTVTN